MKNKLLSLIIAILILVVIGLGILLLIKNTNDSTVYEAEIVIDASLATQPLTDAYIDGLKKFNLKADYSNTDPAYTKLINKEVDLIVVTYPSAEEIKRAEDAGVELVITPVVNEGFVFYTNKANSIDKLSLDQIRKIYTGEITNWKQLGGNDEKIMAYQRPVNSGSQTGMLKLVMNGLKMKQPETTEYVESMAGVIDVVTNYETGKSGIAYSYYYYATTMYGNDDIKFIAVDGVEPNHDTIKNSSYPLTTSYYIVTLKDNDKEEVAKLKETLLSKTGQKIAKSAGYIELD